MSQSLPVRISSRAAKRLIREAAAETARRTFEEGALAEDLRTRTGLPLEELSCGMSDDYPIAVEEGSTIVRLGRTVFDPNYVIQ